MTMLVFIWSSTSFSFQIDNQILKWQSLTKHSYINKGKEQRKEAFEEVMFINVSRDKTIVEDSISKKRTVITDRSRLASLFNLLKNTNYKYIICDIIFDYPTNDDQKLNSVIDSLPNIAFAIDPNLPSKINLPYGGTTSYTYIKNGLENVSDNALKFRMIDGNSQKTLALAVYEAQTGNQLNESYLWLRGIDSSKRLNYQKLDPYLTIQDTLQTSQNTISLWNMYDVLNYPKALNSYANDKIIVIGDFETDIVQTAFGEMPGPLVQYNLYKNITDNNSQIQLPHIIFLFISFTAYTAFIMWKMSKRKDESSSRKLSKLKYSYSILFSTLKISIDTVIIIVISTLSYWFFNFSFEVLPLVFWLILFRLLIRIKDDWKLNKNTNFS